MNLGQAPWKDSGEPFRWILRPTLQLNFKANSWNEFRWPTPLTKIQVDPSVEFQANPSAEK